MRLIVLTLAVLSLSACANTLEGIKKDSVRAGEKMQEVSQVVTAP